MEPKRPVDASDLSPEIVNEIFSYLPKSSLLQLRFLNHGLGSIATAWAFRHVRLDGRESKSSSFIRIAQSATLRSLVREVTLDTWRGPDFRISGDGQWRPVQYSNVWSATKALPYLRLFRNLKTLHLRFRERSEARDWVQHADQPPNIDRVETRVKFLDVVFQCLAGMWSVRTHPFARWEELYDLDRIPAEPIRLETLTVSNLYIMGDENLAKSEAFKKVLSSKSLVDLKLYVAVYLKEGHFLEQVPEKVDVFNQLPHTWLAPEIAGNLQTLSLYSHKLWGYCPRVDFRAIRPGRGSDSGLPCLRKLALGRYVFSHDWQVEWIASLGRKNRSGGLEELYLDQCPIQYRASLVMNADHSTSVIGQDWDGRDIVVSNEGYPLKAFSWESHMPDEDNPKDITESWSTLRWHKVLSRWKSEMKGLKVFKMGSGSEWNGPRPETYNSVYGDAPCEGERLRAQQRFLDFNVFQNFDCPAPASDPKLVSHDCLKKYKNGSGMFDVPGEPLPYMRFETQIKDASELSKIRPAGARMLIPIDHVELNGAPDLEPDTTSRDLAALEDIMSTVEMRRMGVDGLDALAKMKI